MILGREFDMLLTFASLVVGVMLVIGKGSIFMKGGNTKERQEKYDVRKMEKATGVAFIIIGILTGIDSYTTGLWAELVYVLLLIAILGILIFYIRTRCTK